MKVVSNCFSALLVVSASALLCLCIYHMWLDIGKPTIMSHLANCILLAQLIATLMHCCIAGLSWLVCFSRAGFANRVKSQLRQWDPWRALDGSYGSDIHPCVGETSLKALQSCLGLWLALLGLIATPNSPIARCNLPPASHPPHPPPTPPPSHPTPSHPTPLYVQSVILQWLWKKLLKIQQC